VPALVYALYRASLSAFERTFPSPANESAGEFRMLKFQLANQDSVSYNAEVG
jgi:hypothetical protein